MVFGDTLLNYEQWPCKESSTSETAMCYGACLSTVLFQDNFWSVVTGARTPGPLRYVQVPSRVTTITFETTLLQVCFLVFLQQENNSNSTFFKDHSSFNIPSDYWFGF